MKLNVTSTEAWVVEIKDQPGGLARVLERIAAAGANLQCVIARRQPDKPGAGVAFVSPLKGRKVLAAAAAAGFKETRRIASLRVEGPDRPGVGAQMAKVVANAGVNLRGVTAVGLGSKFVVYFGFDRGDDAARAAGALRAWARRR
jgi:hypothetical protein